MQKIETIEELERYIAEYSDTHFFLFKHSTRCPTSSMALEEFKRFAKENPEHFCGYIDIINDRPVSNKVEELSGIQHQSPQVIHYHQGEPVWNASHSSIQKENLQKRLD